MELPSVKKRQLIVVKAVRQNSNSPKRSIFVSRKPKELEEIELHESSNFGNTSPTVIFSILV